MCSGVHHGEVEGLVPKETSWSCYTGALKCG